MMQFASSRRRSLRLAALLLVVLCGFIGVTPTAMAAANPSCTGGPSGTITLPSVTVPSNTAVGTLLGNAVSVTATFNCTGVPSVSATNGGTNSAGIQVFNLLPSQLYPAQAPPASSTNITSLTYATNVPGIGIQVSISPGMSGYDVTPGDQQANAYMVGHVAAPSGSMSVTYTAQLIVINNNGGQVSYGTISNSTALLNYYWYVRGCQSVSGGCNGKQVSTSLGTTLSLSSGTVIAAPTCSINAGSAAQVITLPAISTATLAAKGSVSGLTAFSIGLTCQTGVNATIAWTSAQSTTTAGLMSSTGSANNVGVQLLDQDQDPVAWGTATTVTGASAGGVVTLPYYAQYYRSGNGNVSVGTVSSKATFTVNYQ
ncbi:fimbrial protein [Dyella japonica]|uniref:Type 1 fimbria pilin n=1 Tax=Dyella japonica TaxID=231455 RepID=A0ABV2JXN3_9GAMM